MCGIAGIYNFKGAPVQEAALRAMVAVLKHRGPDAQTTHLSAAVGLGHARLSIVDIAGGAQPMSNDDGSTWITFNGEIFNFVELAKELQSKGYSLRTRSDTEVLLKLYEAYGEECLRHLNGQWAFAIWDKRKRKLFLSRDRLGVRPLFYTQTQQSFYFASEVKSIFQNQEISRELDLRALDEVCTFWSTVSPRTMFRNIHELPPGHSLDIENGKVRVSRYWDLRFEPDDDCGQNESECAEELWSLLQDATRIRLRADVPVATYLSGGLDSSITTTLVKSLDKTPLRSFSVTFEDTEFDESPYQREMIDHLHTAHQEVRCTKNDIAEVFQDVIWHCEKPIVRSSPAPLFLLSRLVRDNGFKVVLTGEGADEMFGGYDIFKEAKVRAFWAAQPQSKLRPLLLSRLYPYLPNLQNQSPAYQKAFFHVTPQDFQDPCFSHLPRWEVTAKLKMFYSQDTKDALGDFNSRDQLSRALPPDFATWPLFSRAQYLEATQLLPGYILSSQGDRVAMAHSVEVRLPFLDHRVVSFAAKLPLRLKMRVLNEKYLLKKCAEPYLPRTIVQRSKQPYRAPDGVSFFTPPLKDYVRDMLSGDRIRSAGIFNPLGVEKLVEKFAKGRAIGMKDNMAFLAIISTQILHHQYIENFERLKNDGIRAEVASICN